MGVVREGVYQGTLTTGPVALGGLGRSNLVQTITARVKQGRRMRRQAGLGYSLPEADPIYNYLALSTTTPS